MRRIGYGLIMVGLLLLGTNLAAGDDESAEARPNFSGNWKLDPDLSDDTREKMREAMQKNRGGRGGIMS